MELNQSYCPNYFSIEDILATQERVPCQVDSDLKNLGFLDPGSDNQVVVKFRDCSVVLTMLMLSGSGKRNQAGAAAVDGGGPCC